MLNFFRDEKKYLQNVRNIAYIYMFYGPDQRSPTIRTSRTTKLTILNPADH
jgi:hypothetical protein